MNEILKEKLACSYFFAAPALAYGLFTSRLPAVRLKIAADDAQIGSIMLALGVATLCGLFLGGPLAEKIGSRKVTAWAVPWVLLWLAVSCLAFSLWQVVASAALAGVGVGFCDVGMNAMGIELEKRRGIFCMSFLHAVSGVGGVLGALSGSLFAAWTLSPFLNAAVVFGVFLLLWPLAWTLVNRSPEIIEKKSRGFGSLPLFIFICAALSLICHIAEGSVGSWGSVFLHSVKGASQQRAALAFAAFTAALVLSRLFADRLRLVLGDFWLMLAGSLLGVGGMTLVLLSPYVWGCLAGYAIMGLGLGPVVPILFSRVGAVPGVTSARASALVSIFSYAGLLFFPPLLGFLAQTVGLAPSLWLITALCALQALGAAAFVKKRG